MSAEAFGREVQTRRQYLRISRTELARRAGLSESGVRNIELGVRGRGGGHWAEPKRETIIDLAVALNWSPDDALRISGQQPLEDYERRRITTIGNEDELRAALDNAWPSLTRSQRRAIVHVVGTMIDPDGDRPDEAGVVVYLHDAPGIDHATTEPQS